MNSLKMHLFAQSAVTLTGYRFTAGTTEHESRGLYEYAPKSAQAIERATKRITRIFDHEYERLYLSSEVGRESLSSFDH